jgi:hypothetical protein
VEDGWFGASRVGAADPEDLGGLAGCEDGEEEGVFNCCQGCPGFVAAEEFVEAIVVRLVLVE